MKLYIYAIFTTTLLLVCLTSFTTTHNGIKSINSDIVLLDSENSINIQKNCRYGYCSATTQRGYSCQNCAKSGSNYCGTHKNKNTYDNGYRYTSSCSAIAKSTGKQCRNKAKSGSMYCGSHGY